MFSSRGGVPLSIDLYRDGVNSPWGFRLKGGTDVDGGTPLEIIKVNEYMKNLYKLLLRKKFTNKQ